MGGKGEEMGKGEGRELGVQQTTWETWDQWELSGSQHTNGNILAEVRATHSILPLLPYYRTNPISCKNMI